MRSKNLDIAWEDFTNIKQAGTLVKSQKSPLLHRYVKYVCVLEDAFSISDVIVSPIYALWSLWFQFDTNWNTKS